MISTTRGGDPIHMTQAFSMGLVLYLLFPAFSVGANHGGRLTGEIG